jgi:hypothetical protein
MDLEFEYTTGLFPTWYPRRVRLIGSHDPISSKAGYRRAHADLRSGSAHLTGWTELRTGRKPLLLSR